jgi:redox-sensing transcriptional repressor
MTTRRISDSTVRRLSGYLRQLRGLAAERRELVSSRELAQASGTTAAQVRKDLSHFGSFGTRGSGYRVPELRDSLARILGLGRTWRVAVVGAGKIGGALLGYGDLARRGFDLVAAFDADPEKSGRSLHGVPVYPMEALGEEIGRLGVEIVILAVPPDVAREAARALSATGVRGILNFAAGDLEPDARVVVRSVDVALELEGLTFALASRTGNGDAAGPDAGTRKGGP